MPHRPHRSVVLVASHFAPNNLVNVHRARLWAQHLPEFGWNPIVLTAHPAYYEEPLDWELNALVDPQLQVIRTRALPIKPVRLVGDAGIRALAPQYFALKKLAEERRIDFVHITIPSNYSALLGRMLHMTHGVPYGIDYNDPWICEYPGTERVGSKKWISVRISEALEPWAVRDASLITGVAAGYYEDMLDRNPHVRRRAVSAAMPFGVSEVDYDYVEQAGGKPYLFDPSNGLHHVVYAGAILPKSHGVLDALFKGMVRLRERNPATAARLRLHFVGTGTRTHDPVSHTVMPYIRRYELQDLAEERPERIPYLDVIRHLQLAKFNLILGSPEGHYTPSKVFQVLRAGRPVLALLHPNSTAVPMVTRRGAGVVLPLDGDGLPRPDAVASGLEEVLRSAALPSVRPLDGADELSARASARTLALALDAASDKSARSVA